MNKLDNSKGNDNVSESGLSHCIPDDAMSVTIMAERAKILAKPGITTDSEINKTNYLKLVIGNNELYGIRYQDIVDVKPAEKITAVPMTPEFVDGIEYWHGKIIPVINLAKYFGVDHESVSTVKKSIVTVMTGKVIVGLTFDDVIGIDMYENGKLDKNIPVNNKILDEYVAGIHAGRVVILNINNILTDISKELNSKMGDKHEK